VPPQVVLRLGVEATAKPPGNGSLKAMPLKATVAFRLVRVNVTLVVPFNGIVVAPKALAMVGGPTTVNIAVLLVEPVPPSVEVIALVELALTPSTVPVTFKAIAQVAPGASDAPLKLMLPLAEMAVAVPVQVEFSALGLATTRPLGSESEKARLLSVTTELGLVMVKLRLVEPPTGINEAPNTLLMVAGSPMLMVAEAVLPVPPLVDETAPLVLFLAPSVVPVTFTVTVQFELTGMEAPLSETELVPAVAVTEPLQVLAMPGVGAMSRPAGKVSLKATPVSI